MSAKLRVVISDYDYGDVHIERNIIEAAGFELVALQCKSDEELAEAAEGASAIMNQYCRVGARTMAQIKTLRHIARYGIGVDIVDVEAATSRNILVTNVPHNYCLEEVADHAMAMLLALARKLREYDRETRKGIWHWQTGRPIHRLRGRTMGILSFGNIGQAIAARGRVFGMTVIAHDPYVPTEDFERHQVQHVSLDELLERSDYLMNQVPLTKETRGIIGERELRRMKPSSLLINTGRGPTVDNQALYRALTEGWIAGAGLDDMEEEPAKKHAWKPEDNPLFTLDTLYITPHAAYYSEESIQTARTFAANEVVRVLSGHQPLSPVNHVLGNSMA